MIKNLFKFRSQLGTKTILGLQVSGLIILTMIWSLLPLTGWVDRKIFPSLIDIIVSFKQLLSEDFLIWNIGYSIYLNSLGYLQALIITLPLGFIIGLYPIFNISLGKYIDALRYVPLTAVTGLFIAWFGISTNMKVQFLSFGIIVYLLPIVVQRVNEVSNVHLQTIQTLGATHIQTITKIFIPSVMSKLIDDIRIIIAMTWTYIIVVEMINMKEGGIGSLIYLCARQSRIDKVFAILLVIILIGFVQDKLFKYLDLGIFKFKRSQK